jgi:hypothetical protein
MGGQSSLCLFPRKNSLFAKITNKKGLFANQETNVINSLNGPLLPPLRQIARSRSWPRADFRGQFLVTPSLSVFEDHLIMYIQQK